MLKDDFETFCSNIELDNLEEMKTTIKEITKNKPTGMKIVDLKGKYVLPGLINMHVHLPGSGMPKDTKKQNKESVNKLLSFKL